MSLLHHNAGLCTWYWPIVIVSPAAGLLAASSARSVRASNTSSARSIGASSSSTAGAVKERGGVLAGVVEHAKLALGAAVVHEGGRDVIDDNVLWVLRGQGLRGARSDVIVLFIRVSVAAAEGITETLTGRTCSRVITYYIYTACVRYLKKLYL